MTPWSCKPALRKLCVSSALLAVRSTLTTKTAEKASALAELQANLLPLETERGVSIRQSKGLVATTCLTIFEV